jgi:hypothetical protein
MMGAQPTVRFAFYGQLLIGDNMALTMYVLRSGDTIHSPGSDYRRPRNINERTLTWE